MYLEILFDCNAYVYVVSYGSLTETLQDHLSGVINILKTAKSYLKKQLYSF